MKRFIFVLILFALSFIRVYASDYNVDPGMKINIDIYDNKAEANECISLYSENSTEKEIESTLHEALVRHELILISVNDVAVPAVRVDLSQYNLDVSTEESYNQVAALLYDLVFQHLDYFYPGGSLYPYIENNVLTNLFIDVRTEFTGGSTLDEMQATFDSYVNAYNLTCTKILADTLYPGMTDAEIALALHSYLGDSLYYDDDLESMSFTAYSGIMGEKAVCQGYAFAFKHLLRLLGIDSVIATSSEMNHAWNVINIDGDWYHADATRDDIEGYGVMHRYFLLSDETLEDRGHYGWTASASCVSKKYESGYFFNPEYTDALYSSDFMTCRRNSEGYFLYIRDNKYYKSLFDGTPEEISEAQYNYDKSFKIKLSAPFIYTDETFSFESACTDNVNILIASRSDNSITGKFIAAYYNSDSIADAKITSELIIEPSSYTICNLNTAPEFIYMQAFFWDSSLKPYAEAVYSE